jgi:ComF family protein
MSALKLVRRWARALARPLEDLVWPERCWAAGTPLAADETALTDAVRQQIARGILWPYCTRCGSTTGPHTAHDRRRPCVECVHRPLGVARVARVGTYDPPLTKLVRQLKFGRRWEVAAVLAPFLLQALAPQRAAGAKVDVLVPVPLHRLRRWARGFDQSEMLAAATARLDGGIPMASALRRIRRTHEQSRTASAHERRENLRGAFACVDPRRVAGRHVWLVDDVTTTGATIHAAALALRHLPLDQRPASINALVVCATSRTPRPEPLSP